MNIYLIGYRGCGKSSVAPLVARTLGRRVVDTDQRIEQATGRTIAEIFAVDGETVFRDLEQKAVAAVAEQTSQVVSLGGGAILREANRCVLAETGKTVWLTATAEVLWARISGDDASDSMRPNLTDTGGLAEVERVLAERTSVYDACADYTIDTNGRTIEQIAEQICQWWQSVDKG